MKFRLLILSASFVFQGIMSSVANAQEVQMRELKLDAECYLNIFSEVKAPLDLQSAGLIVRLVSEGGSSEGIEIILLNQDRLPIRSLAADASGTVIFKSLECRQSYYLASAGERGLSVKSIQWLPEWGFETSPLSIQQQYSDEGLHEISLRLKAIDLTTGKAMSNLEFHIEHDGSILKKEYTEEDGSLVFEHLPTDKTYKIVTSEHIPEIIIINLFDHKLTPLKRGTI
jgi:hypothetical protein